ncbi:BadF/BadG/BcrA/BcrD ATPase family protein [Kitasatospora sp. A2-31]|uniref:N-acetylglucosamine kinase n=1 Tax=Kitasatospora sp. A2-31 TaxID=2916414 RepID=UPI001EEC1929|nr:BadF/BadG/BcrA/BcrD ATPase family protein [Kitasatospora sp. A2-31]MCG6497851.1 ATPase [Kitasatospora sp. A2-31]
MEQADRADPVPARASAHAGDRGAAAGPAEASPPPPVPVADVWVVGIDVGGTGARLALAPADRSDDLVGVRTRDLPVAARITASGHDADALLARLIPELSSLAADLPHHAHIGAVAVGATGMALLGRDLAAGLPGTLARATGAERLVLAGDAVAAYVGALGTRAGVTVAAGTGLVAIGHRPGSGWRRADGWGQLLGDCGSGGWIGRAGLEAALRAYDGRSGGSPALLERAERRYGPVTGLPAALQPRPDRAALLAAFAPEVAGAADDGCPVAGVILRRAGEEIAATAAAAATAAGLAEPRLALTGGLFNLARLRSATEAALADRLPTARLRRPDGPPLLGALRLAAAAAAAAPLPWPIEPPLLAVHRPGRP